MWSAAGGRGVVSSGAAAERAGLTPFVFDSVPCARGAGGIGDAAATYFRAGGSDVCVSRQAGEWIGYQANRGQFEHVSVVRADGTAMKVLTPLAGRNWLYSFSGGWGAEGVAYENFQVRGMCM